jgi:hypothetical protein
MRRLSAHHRPVTSPLILVHAHEKGTVPPGQLENGMVELERNGLILHALVEIVLPDGTFCDLPTDRIKWAAGLSYRHLKREGLLDAYGIQAVSSYGSNSEAQKHFRATSTRGNRDPS